METYEDGMPDPDLRELDDAAEPEDGADDDLHIDLDDDTSEPTPPDPEAVVPGRLPPGPAPRGPRGDRHRRAQTAAPGLEPPRRFTRQLVCKMYPEELAKKAVALAAALTAHEARENEIKEEAKAAREELTGMWEDVKKLSRIVTAGGEEREVECELVRNDREGSIETVRLDTGEVIDRRAQDAKERQLPLRATVATDAPPDAEAKGEPSAADETPEELKGERCAVIVDEERCESIVAAGSIYCQEHIDDGTAPDTQCENYYGGSRCKRQKHVGRDYCIECIGDDEAFAREQDAKETWRPRCAADGCTEEAGAAGVFCGQHAEVVDGKRKKKRGRGAKG